MRRVVCVEAYACAAKVMPVRGPSFRSCGLVGLRVRLSTLKSLFASLPKACSYMPMASRCATRVCCTYGVMAFSPGGWVADDTLSREDAAEIRAALLSNASYKLIGPAVDVLGKQSELLGKLNLPGHGPIVSPELIQEQRGIAAHGDLTVRVTFSLYVLYEKIPKCADSTLQKAEVESFLAKMKASILWYVAGMRSVTLN